MNITFAACSCPLDAAWDVPAPMKAVAILAERRERQATSTISYPASRPSRPSVCPTRPAPMIDSFRVLFMLLMHRSVDDPCSSNQVDHKGQWKLAANALSG